MHFILQSRVKIATGRSAPESFELVVGVTFMDLIAAESVNIPRFVGIHQPQHPDLIPQGVK